jgi:hypothetical protein
MNTEKTLKNNETTQLGIGAVIGSYLILDKSNKVVTEKSTLDEAKSFVAARPYLRYESFELPNTSVACDLDDIL